MIREAVKTIYFKKFSSRWVNFAQNCHFAHLKPLLCLLLLCIHLWGRQTKIFFEFISNKESHSTEVTSLILLFSEVASAIGFERRNLSKNLVEARDNLFEMHLIQSLKNEFCLPLFSKYPATSKNSYFYKMTLSL